MFNTQFASSTAQVKAMRYPTFWIMIASGLILAGNARAQTQAYETPLYKMPQREGLNPNYGLPTFGMPGSDLPPQKALASPETANSQSDIFKSPRRTTDVQKAAPSPDASDTFETPTYTTSQDGETSSTDTTPDTP